MGESAATTSSLDVFDARCSQALREELPGLEAAFDEGRMRGHLQAALFEGDGHRYIIERCDRGKAAYVPDEGCVVRYAIAVRDHVGGLVTQALVSGRLFASARASRMHFESCLALAAAMHGRNDVAPFATRVAMLEPLAMNVSLYPIDGELPTLVGATDPATVLEILRDALPRAIGTPFTPLRCGVDVAHYPREHHCVLRYTLEGTRSNGGETSRMTVFGKVAANDRGTLTAVAVPELHERLLGGKTRRFTVPRSLGFVDRLKLTLLEAISGVPRIGQLLRERLQEGRGPDGTPTLEGAIDAAAGVAAGLHTSSIALGPNRRIQDELLELEQARLVLQRLSPHLGAAFHEWLEAVAAYAGMSDPWSACFTHGDFSPSQLLFSGEQCSLIDFDTVCQAEPALDLGAFIAYLRLSSRKAGASASAGGRAATEGLCARFLEAYMVECGLGPGAREALRVRVHLYEMVSLLRLAFHGWLKFKPARLELAAGLTRERIAEWQ
ncbi:MAG: hypothetical protein E6J71_23455 [Deltaproteobacteria bacterium]|nr:MAG: hypothetical protein E6J71_23455 [Deltaproteobacteria bacterium]